MPANTPDQQLTLPVDPDSADNPVAFTNFVTDVEPRLVRQYADVADRAARQLVVAANEISSLVTEARIDAYDGANNVSLHTRSLHARVQMGANQLLTISNTTLQNLTALVVAVPTAGTYDFRGVFFYDSSTVADIKFAINTPVGVDIRWAAIGLASGAGAVTGDFTSLSTSVTSALIVGGGGVGNVIAATCEGTLVTGGTAGNLQLQAAQNTSDATQTTVRQYSRFEVWRVL